MKYNITLWKDNVPVEQHTFTISLGDYKEYVSTISIDAFSQRENKRLFKEHSKGNWGTIGKRCVVKFEEKSHCDSLPIKKYEISYKHKTVWDFYMAIGYDFKKQKYSH